MKRRSSTLSRRLCLLWAACLLLPAVARALDDYGRIFRSYDASNGLADNSAQVIKCTRTGRMVISTIGHINFYDGAGFTHIDPTAENTFPLPKYNGHYHLYFDRHHHLWVKDKHSVTCVDLTMERFVKDVGKEIQDMGMQKRVDDLFTDNDSHIWFLSGNTLYGLDDNKEIAVRQSAELQDVDVYNGQQMLQFFANGTVSVVDIASGRHAFDAPAYDAATAERYAASSVILPDSNVYYQIRNGREGAVLLRFDIETRQWRQLMQTPYHLNNMALRKALLYVASEYGYWIYDVRTGETEHVEQLTLSRNRKLLTDINTIAFDRQGGLWLGTEKRGVLYSKPFASPFVNYTWDQPEAIAYEALLTRTLGSRPELPRHVNCQYRDSRGWLWTGLYTGLQLERPGASGPRLFTDEDGLFNEMVHCVIEDDNHDIWAGTSFGISHLFIEGDSVRHIETYTSSDNVPNESFVDGRAMKQADGTIIMQQLDHIVVFNPRNFHPGGFRSMTLAPKLVKLMVNGHVVEPGVELDGRVILDRAVTRIWELNVDYDQNSIAMLFSGLNYVRPVQTYYRVRVQGLDDTWRVYNYSNSKGAVDNHGLFHLRLPALKPGKYVVQVQTSMVPDNWDMRSYDWVINVEEPWWRSTGIYVLLGLLLVALALANVFLYNRNSRMLMMRSNKEGDILKRLRNYVTRCDEMKNDVLEPVAAEKENGTLPDKRQKEFLEVMQALVPYLHEHQNEPLSVSQLAEVTGKDVAELFGLLSENLYKSPRHLAGRLRLQEAAGMLRQTDLTVDEIAKKCMFVSTNYFISSFFHLFRETPEHYRNTTPL